ncbi:hypothetical protein [Brevibacillus daliensis]|uniref:hypothetical protein n=1 Tax=Brevibacillus daliensis TaxID=2892995 RepID=UPI001E38BCD0|nr:hypothetical protein [Brevibacillus daliensis]
MEKLIGKICDEYNFIDMEYKEENGRQLLYTERGLHYLHSCPPAYKHKGFLVEKVIDAIQSNCSLEVLPVCKTREGGVHLKYDDKLYYLQEGLRETNVEEHYYLLGKTLAEFHKATCSCGWDKLYTPYLSNGSWNSMWEKKCKEYEEFLDDLDELECYSELDVYLLTMFNYVNQLGKTAIKYLDNNGYRKMVPQIAKHGKIAFQNFQEGHIIFHESGSCYLAGQYSWVLDIRTRDIGQGIKWLIRKHGWNEEHVIQFLKGYNCVAELYKEEYAFIYAILLYPSKFLKSVEDYSVLSVEEREQLGEEWKTGLEKELVLMEHVLGEYPQAIAEHFTVTIPEINWLWRFSRNDEKTICIRDEESFGRSFESSYFVRHD